jgi:hypothetical protein
VKQLSNTPIVASRFLIAGLISLVCIATLIISDGTFASKRVSVAANSYLRSDAALVKAVMPIATSTPDHLQPPAGTLDGQLWFVSGGNPSDTSAGHINSDASNPTLLSPTLPEAQGSIGLDLPAGYYFTVSTDHPFIEAHRISDNFKVDEVQIGDAAGAGPADDDIVNALAVDPINEFIYVGKWGQTLAQSATIRRPVFSITYSRSGRRRPGSLMGPGW